MTACTSVNVNPVSAGDTIKTVYIERNPKVEVDDFLDVLVGGFARHGIASKVVDDTANIKGQYIVTYVAWRNWDLAPYLRDAVITITKDDRIVGHAEYHLVGKGGLSPLKWEGTKTKMDPVIDQLLQSTSCK